MRVADTIDEEAGSRIRNSNRQQGETGCMRQVAAWCDYSGVVAGRHAGVTLLVHPANPPTAFFTRAYGTMLANPTLLQAVHIPAGTALVQRFRLLVHDGEWEHESLDLAHAAFAADPT